MESNVKLDCKGLHCPMPVIKTKKVMEEMKSGEILELEATDKGSLKDIPAFAKRTGHELLDTKEIDGIFVFYLRKK